MALKATHLLHQRLLVFFGAIHAALFAYDLGHPGRFLNADRASERIDVVRAFIDTVQSGGDPWGFLAAHGVPGDWLPQALLYLAGGQYLVIAVQIALALLSLSCVARIAGRLKFSAPAAAAAAALYGLLPHSLVFPHQLAAEAIFVPLVVLSFGAALGFGSGLALGAATLVRPVTLLWAPLYALAEKGPSVARALFLFAALGPMLAWVGFIFVATGEVSMGRSSHDLGHNLYVRAHRMAAALPESERPERRAPGHTTMGIGEYLAFVLQHPGAAASHSGRDFLTLAAKSGVERLTLDYLDLFPQTRALLQDSESGWRARVEQDGLAAALAGLWRTQRVPMLVSTLAALAFAGFMALALVGAVSWLRRDRRGESRRKLLLLGFVAYIFFTAQAVDAAQSRHRAPAEFALCLLAVAGWLRVRASLPLRAPAPRPAIS